MATEAEKQLIETLVDALASMLNVEGPARAGASLVTVWQGLDVPYHFNQARTALLLAEAQGYPIK